MNTNLLTKEEKAKDLGISYRQLDRRIKQGKIDIIYVRNSKRKWFLPEMSRERNHE